MRTRDEHFCSYKQLGNICRKTKGIIQGKLLYNRSVSYTHLDTPACQAFQIEVGEGLVRAVILRAHETVELAVIHCRQPFLEMCIRDSVETSDVLPFQLLRTQILEQQIQLRQRCLLYTSVVVVVGFVPSFLPKMPKKPFRFGFLACSCTLFCTITGI